MKCNIKNGKPFQRIETIDLRGFSEDSKKRNIEFLKEKFPVLKLGGALDGLENISISNSKGYTMNIIL